MALRLRVVSEHSTRLGAQSTKVFACTAAPLGARLTMSGFYPTRSVTLGQTRAHRFPCRRLRSGRHQLQRHVRQRGAVPLGKYHDYALRMATTSLGRI